VPNPIQQFFLNGGLNLDDSLLVPPAGQKESLFQLGDYRYALNCRIGGSRTNNMGAVENILGTELKTSLIYIWNGANFTSLVSQLPTFGTNKCIGYYENKATQEGIFFNWNSDGDHGIYLFDLKLNKVHELFGPGVIFGTPSGESAILNFDQNKEILGVSIVGRILLFTDDLNPPRMIDMDNIYKTRYDVQSGGKDITDFHLNLIKPPPVSPPVLVISTGAAEKKLEKGVFQACYRYVYKDGTRSVWSPRSNIATAMRDVSAGYDRITIWDEGAIYGLTPAEETANNGFNGIPNNEIRVQAFIDHIEVAIRNSQNDTYRIITATDFAGIGNTLATFDNDSEGVPVPPSELNQLFDNVPLLSKTLTVINNRVMLGNNTEDFPHIPDFAIENVTVYSKITPVSDNFASITRAHFPVSSTYDRLHAMNNGNTLSFKEGGIYQLAVEFGDENGRKSLAYTDPQWNVKIPRLDFGTTGSYWHAIGFNFVAGFTPPNWATWYQILRSECLNMDFFAVGVCNKFELRKDLAWNIGITAAELKSIDSHPSFIRIAGLLDTEIVSLASIGIASYIYIDIRNWTNASRAAGSVPRETEAQLLVNIKADTAHGTILENPSNKIFYNFEEGDIVRFKADLGSGPVVVEYPIVKVVGHYLVVDMDKAITDLPGLGGGLTLATNNKIIEVYRPKKPSEGAVQFYECGEWYPILFPKTASRAFSKTDWRFTDNNSITVNVYSDYHIYGKYPVRNGDVHLINKPMFLDYVSGGADQTTDPFHIECMKPDPDAIAGSWEHASGRPNVAYEKQAVQKKKTTQVRFGGLFIVDSIRNNINNFQGFDQKVYPLSFGDIQLLRTTSNAQVESIGDIMLMLCENQTVSIYVDRSTVEELSGNTQILLSDKVLGSFNTLLGDHGTLNPESYVQDKGRSYYYDSNNGEWIRYSRDGLTSISDYKMRNFFKQLGNLLLPEYLDYDTRPRVISGYDRYNDELVVNYKHASLPGSFYNLPGEYKTVSFNDLTGHRRWRSFYSFTPEKFGSIGDYLVAFNNGQMFLHEAAPSDDTHNLFYFENKADSLLELVANQFPKDEKTWHTINLIASHKWSIESFITDVLGSSTIIPSTPQETFLELDKFEARGTAFYSEIPGDKNTPNAVSEEEAIINGDPMKGRFLRVLMKLDPDIVVSSSLQMVNIGFTESKKN
jgi:hypothetical protein